MKEPIEMREIYRFDIKKCKRSTSVKRNQPLKAPDIPGKASEKTGRGEKAEESNS